MFLVEKKEKMNYVKLVHRIIFTQLLSLTPPSVRADVQQWISLQPRAHSFIH